MKLGLRGGLSSLVLVGVVVCAWLNPLEEAATQRVDAGLKRAILSFATARGLNAVLSVVQGTDIAVEPGGVGVKFAPGQLLRPINDLVSQFAELMLAASVAFGVMKVSIVIGSHWVFSAGLTGAALAWMWYWWRDGAAPGWLARTNERRRLFHVA